MLSGKEANRLYACPRGKPGSARLPLARTLWFHYDSVPVPLLFMTSAAPRWAPSIWEAMKCCSRSSPEHTLHPQMPLEPHKPLGYGPQTGHRSILSQAMLGFLASMVHKRPPGDTLMEPSAEVFTALWGARKTRGQDLLCTPSNCSPAWWC